MKYLIIKIKLFFAYIIALVFVTFTYFPYSLLKWIFSYFKKINYDYLIDLYIENIKKK
jgi:hypothetical protein